ncbi:DUF938 domain-containing protein [Roseateles cellulosilyticus]|uniref:Class I SAM-dependent methyltransferase n=1 Tax=Pelomonas cellulosilytica TaxID=2906762 RepID=A0ABS8Y0D8_9BURK|nr:DUF938 domain-containing protein [Pelomonas sp. P8]MCE4556486.1 class I SAM-dependent methyltransferase [Pelomonas sp. P8]
MPDDRRHSPAAERNGPHILTALQRLLPPTGVLLEIASGSGQHAAFCSAGLPGWQWQPSDVDADALPSIVAWCDGLPNVRPPLHLNVLDDAWPGVPAQVDAIYCANMIHASPWPTTAGLMQGAARHLAPDGLLLTYGAYLVDGEPVAASNLAFDADLRTRHPAWGLRRLAAVVEQAEAAGLKLRERVAMPANNQLLVWARPR